VLTDICSSHDALTERTMPTAIWMVQPLNAGLSSGTNFAQFVYYTQLKTLMVNNVVHV